VVEDYAAQMRCVLFVALLLAACGPAPLEPREPTPGVAHFSVATFNVHYPTAGDTETSAAVAATGADIVFLQETDAAWAGVLAGDRFDYPYRLLKIDEGPRGLAVLSRFPIEDKGLLPAPHDWHPAWRVVVDTPAGALQVFHVHLRSKFEGAADPVSDFFATAHDHRGEIEHFFASADALPTLVVGDFNEEPHGAAIEWLENRGFENVLPLYHPGQWTWRGRSVAGQFALTIDHILFDAWLVPLNAWVSTAGHSDHSPVVAHFEAAPGAQN
jgi:endonuclease/exonuclease/phosphatase family metal-dependent hydrolase